MAGFSNDVMYANNVDFSGGKSATVLLDGQLLIGSTATPHIRVGTLTAGAGISITNSAGGILITNTGGGGGGGLTTLNAQSGAATQSGGVINVVGTTGITTIGGGMTLTLAPANDLAALEAISTTGYAVRTALETWTTRTFQAGSGITLINADGVAGNTMITADTNVPTIFTADSGMATPAANNINIVGTGSTLTSASGSSVVVSLAGMTNHAVLVGAGTATLTKLGVGSNGQVLIGATAADPAFASLTSSDSSITFTTGVNTLSLQVASGTTVGKTITGDSGGALSPTAGNWNLLGTGSITTSGAVSTLTTQLTGLTNHAVLVGAGTATITKLGIGSNGQVLIGASAADPAFATLTSSDSSITFTTGANTLSLQVAGGTTAIKTITGNSGGAESPSSGNFNILGTGSITTVGSANTETVQLTGLTANSVLYGLGTATVGLLASGTTGQVLQTNTGAAPTYSIATYPSSITVSQILYSSSTNVVGGLATANRAVLTTGTTGIPVLTPLATDGQLIIGSTAASPAAATLTAGTGITITNGSNSITIATTGAGFSVLNVQVLQGGTGGTVTPTYTPTAGMKYCFVECIAAGGGGGGAVTVGATQASNGGGGGAGGYNCQFFTAANIGATATTSIGAAGTVGSSAGGNGGNGGDCTFTPTGTGLAISSGGGTGGTGSSTAATNCSKSGGGGGNSFTNGLFGAFGGGGCASIGFGATFSMSGKGGDGYFGGGSQGKSVASGSNGVGVNAGIGGGGSGGCSLNAAGVAGGAGGIGIIVITEYA